MQRKLFQLALIAQSVALYAALKQLLSFVSFISNSKLADHLPHFSIHSLIIGNIVWHGIFDPPSLTSNCSSQYHSFAFQKRTSFDHDHLTCILHKFKKRILKYMANTFFSSCVFFIRRESQNSHLGLNASASPTTNKFLLLPTTYFFRCPLPTLFYFCCPPVMP